jgi:hypothetical protein
MRPAITADKIAVCYVEFVLTGQSNDSERRYMYVFPTRI